jgi:hypothetical protein
VLPHHVRSELLLKRPSPARSRKRVDRAGPFLTSVVRVRSNERRITVQGHRRSEIVVRPPVVRAQSLLLAPSGESCAGALRGRPSSASGAAPTRSASRARDVTGRRSGEYPPGTAPAGSSVRAARRHRGPRAAAEHGAHGAKRQPCSERRVSRAEAMVSRAREFDRHSHANPPYPHRDYIAWHSAPRHALVKLLGGMLYRRDRSLCRSTGYAGLR